MAQDFLGENIMPWRRRGPHAQYRDFQPVGILFILYFKKKKYFRISMCDRTGQPDKNAMQTHPQTRFSFSEKSIWENKLKDKTALSTLSTITLHKTYNLATPQPTSRRLS